MGSIRAFEQQILWKISVYVQDKEFGKPGNAWCVNSFVEGLLLLKKIIAKPEKWFHIYLFQSLISKYTFQSATTIVSYLFYFKVLCLDILYQSATTIKRWERFYYIIILVLCKYGLDALQIVLILHYFKFWFEGTKDIVWGYKGWKKWIANKTQWLTVYNPGEKITWLCPWRWSCNIKKTPVDWRKSKQ